MLKKATAMDVRKNFGEILNEIQYRHDTVVITKAGKPVAALVDIDLFEKIRQMRTQFDKLSAELAASYKEVDPVAAEKEIAEAIKKTRGK